MKAIWPFRGSCGSHIASLSPYFTDESVRGRGGRAAVSARPSSRETLSSVVRGCAPPMVGGGTVVLAAESEVRGGWNFSPGLSGLGLAGERGGGCGGQPGTG